MTATSIDLFQFILFKTIMLLLLFLYKINYNPFLHSKLKPDHWAPLLKLGNLLNFDLGLLI